MTRISSILLCAILFLISTVSSGNWIGKRADSGEIPPAALQYNGSITKLSPFLEGRSLVNSLLESREETCNDPGWQVCASEPGCCPTAALCCPNTPYCKNEASDTCCALSGVCPSGWQCTDLCQCIEAGGQCCDNGKYCQKGNICVISPYYGFGCCTNLQCTAYVSNGVTVPLTTNPPTQPPTQPATQPATMPTQPATTPAPQPTVTQETYYYFTITWSYYFYYYFTFFQVVTTSTLTSSYTTEYTTVSIFATNSADASASFDSVSSNFIPSTPAAATTALAPQTAAPTSTAPTASATLFPSFSDLPSSTSAASSPHAGGDAGPTNAGSGSVSRASRVAVPESWLMTALALIAVAPGVAMLLL